MGIDPILPSPALPSRGERREIDPILPSPALPSRGEGGEIDPILLSPGLRGEGRESSPVAPPAAGAARAGLRTALLLVCLLPLVACGSLRGGRGGIGLSSAPDDGSTLPWTIPAEAFGSQRLYRVSYDGPEGEGSFRVTLRLASPLRYQLQAADPVGRALWGVDVTSEHGVWLDHRNKVTCAFQGSFDVAGIPLGPFPLFSLPSLLLGRLPAAPAPDTEAKQVDRPDGEGREIELRDDLGRRWIADLDGDGAVAGWTLWESGKPTVWFQRRESWAYLSDHARGMQLRWREVLREDLAQEPQALAPPSGYREGSCRDLYQARPGL